MLHPIRCSDTSLTARAERDGEMIGDHLIEWPDPIEAATPYRRVNQAFNPFGELPRDEIPLVADIDPALFELAEREGHALLILGDKGHGKSTHLAAIRQRISPDSPYHYFPEDEPPPTYEPSDIGFVDEFQRAGWLFRRRLFRRARTLVIASHVDHSDSLARAGFEVTGLVLNSVSPNRIRRMAELRFERARVSESPVPRLADGAERWLANKHGANLRAVEHSLYTVAQQHFSRMKEEPDGQV